LLALLAVLIHVINGMQVFKQLPGIDMFNTRLALDPELRAYAAFNVVVRAGASTKMHAQVSATGRAQRAILATCVLCVAPNMAQ
jgi:hypothetical protein